MPAFVIAFLLGNWRLLAGAAAVLVVMGGLRVAYLNVRHEGYVEGFGVAHQQCEDDKAKQETANQNAINAAAEKLAELQKNLDLKDAENEKYLAALDQAADAGPGSTDACLDADSVRRLSAVH